MTGFVQGQEIVIVLVIVLLSAGGTQLPKLIRALGGAPKSNGHENDGPVKDDTPES
jgi:Sec-independent protein translocase protein TatA